MFMPATLLVDAGYLVILGGLFGLAAWPDERGGVARRPLVCALAALALFGIGVPVYFYSKWPDWMWGYAVHHHDLPAWIVPLAFALYPPVFLAAFFAAFRGGRAAPWRAWAVVGVGVVLQIGLIAATWHRYRHTGPFAGFPGPDDEVLTVCMVAAAIGVAALWRAARPDR